MAVSDLNTILAKWGQTYLILDISCLFVASSLREEVWLYCHRDNPDILVDIERASETFKIRGVNPDRELTTYSGGEQAILACLLMIALIRALNVTKTRLLLSGILESVSRDNRLLLRQFFEPLTQSHQISLYRSLDGVIESVLWETCT